MTMMDAGWLHSVRDYIDFDAHSADLVRDFRPLAQPFFRDVVDDFYATIDQHAEARHVITGGQEQVERLKSSLTEWLESLLGGTYDEEFIERHSRIGRVHVRIGLPQHLMFTAMSRVRAQLARIAARTLVRDPERATAVTAAVHKLLDMELAIMLDSYREDLIERQRAHERLATIGELAASVGHELRNPLGTMETSLFLMQRRFRQLGIDDAQISKHHDKASRQVDQCNDTISRLLDLARDRPPRAQWLSLRGLLRETVERLPLSATTRVSVEVDDHVDVWADPTQLGLVVANLVRNASEAAPAGVDVHIRAAADRGGVALMVYDDGPGIPKSKRAQVFQALFTTRSQGTGLGLALAKRIIEAHHGELSLVDTESGAAFRVWLPGPPEASA